MKLTSRLTKALVVALNAGGFPPADGGAVVPVATISGAPSVTEGGNLAYTVTIDTAASSNLTINITYSGTATRNTDYTGADSLTIAAGSTSGSLIVTTIDDSTVESSETVIVTLAAGTGYALGANTTSTGTIVDNDVTPNPLLIAGMYNTITNGSEARAYTNCAISWTYTLGSGALSHVALLCSAWRASYGTNQILANLNDFTLDAATIEYNNISVPVTFGGATSRAFAAADAFVESDVIPATAFGVSSIPVGALIRVKMLVHNAAVSQYLPTANRHIASGGQVWWYNPANTMISNINTVGAFTSTGTTTDKRNNGWTPQLLGRYVSSAAKVWGVFGDSITQGTGDTGGTARTTGLGWAGFAMVDADGTSNPQSYVNWAVHGSATVLATANAANYYPITKYITHAILMWGTNNFGTTGTGQTLAAVQTAFDTVAGALKSTSGSRVTKVIGGHLLPRTTSTDQWVTTANQAYSGAGWQSGGNVDLYNQHITDLVGTTLAASIHWTAPRDTTDNYKWKVDGATVLYATTDGTHPSTLTYTGMGSEMRTLMATL
jgi:hypothetical protein